MKPSPTSTRDCFKTLTISRLTSHPSLRPLYNLMLQAAVGEMSQYFSWICF